MGTVGSTDKKIGSPRPSHREREVQFRSTAENAAFNVPDLGAYSDFEECALSEEKGREEKNQIRTPLLVSSSPPRLGRDRDVKLDERSSEDLPPEKEEDRATQPEIKTSEFNSFTHPSRIPSDKRQEYELWLRSELAKRHLDGYHDLSFKTVDGKVRVRFKRRFKGGRVPLDKKGLQEAIQQAERLVMSPVIAETNSRNFRDWITVKRISHQGHQYIELINVPPHSPIVAEVSNLLHYFVYRMYEGACKLHFINSAKVHAFRVAPSGKQRPEFNSIKLSDYEDEILRITMQEISVLANNGYDIHNLDKEATGTLEKRVTRRLAKSLSIDFSSIPKERIVELDA
jgi:hypothetical protein